MKKILLVLLTAMMLLSLVACKNKEGETITDPVVNPMVEVTSNEDFKDLGLESMAHAEALSEYCTDIKYFIVDKNIAEIDFTYANHDYCYRGSKEIAPGKLLGVYGEALTTSTETIADIPFTFQSYNEGLTAVWMDDLTSYTLFGEGLNEDENYEFGLVTMALAKIDIDDYVTVELPTDLHSFTKDALDLWFDENGFKDVDWEYQNSEEVAENHIIALSKEGKVYPEDEIIAYVSLGKVQPKTALVPDTLLNSTEEDFIKQIETLGMVPTKNTTTYYSTTIKANRVFSYDDGTFPIGTKIVYHLSKGAYAFNEDEYNGLTKEKAQELVDKYNKLNAHINLNLNEHETVNHTAGTIYKCSSEKDGYKTNVTCKLAVAPKTKTVDLPNYVGTYNNPCGSGDTCSINDINYTINKVEDENPAGYISAQSVAAGKVNVGTSVTLTVSVQQPYLYRVESGYYTKFNGDWPSATQENLLKKEALGLFKNVTFELDRSAQYPDSSIVQIYIMKDGEWTDNWIAGNYPSSTQIKVVIEDQLMATTAD